jgi:hypothetical protein
VAGKLGPVSVQHCYEEFEEGGDGSNQDSVPYGAYEDTAEIHDAIDG